MGNDISEGAKIGIILIILCALVGIVFALLTMMKNITNSGSSSLQNGLDMLSDSEFQDYDQKTVTGTQVLSALKIFEGRPVAFVVKTSAIKESDNFYGYNYGALLDGVNTTENAEPASDGFLYPVRTALEKPEGSANFVRNLNVVAGQIKTNGNIKPVSTPSTKAYIRSSAKFLAEIILDESGTKVGVVFTQQQ